MNVQSLQDTQPSLLDNPFALSRGTEFEIPSLSESPQLLVVVDTEETFDWAAPFDRDSTDTKAMSEIGRGQDLCEAAGLAPTYVVDYPVASDARAMGRLSKYQADKRATIGAHLHSWVSPPFEEVVNTTNSYQGNLPIPLEKKKLYALRKRIEENSGTVPVIHKAGRYGFGWGTTKNLLELGFSVDLSASPGFDMTGDGGPNHDRISNAPLWLDDRRSLLSIPGTGGFVGLLRGMGPALQNCADSSLGLKFRATGILSRLCFMERIRLSPEGFNLEEMKKLTYSLLNQGEKVFTLTYHSPSLDVGCTPYVRDKHDLKEFLGKMKNYFRFFFDELGGRPAAPLSLLEELRVSEEARVK